MSEKEKQFIEEYDNYLRSKKFQEDEIIFEYNEEDVQEAMAFIDKELNKID